MRPVVKARAYTIYVTRDREVRIPWGWDVFWVDGNNDNRSTHFWTWEAALDFALERVLDFRKINHPHLWV